MLVCLAVKHSSLRYSNSYWRRPACALAGLAAQAGSQTEGCELFTFQAMSCQHLCQQPCISCSSQQEAASPNSGLLGILGTMEILRDHSKLLQTVLSVTKNV